MITRPRREAETLLQAAGCAAERISSQKEKEWAYLAIAFAQIRSGWAVEAMSTVNRLLVDSDRTFPYIAESLVQQRAHAVFKRFLLLAASDIRTALHACGQLAVLYPVEADAIAELLISRK